MTHVINPRERTAEEWRECARECRQRSRESWERSDTDGFLSQWASDTMATAYERAASLAENGCTTRELRLFDLDGNLLDARLVDGGRYGPSWRIWNEDTREVSWFRESRARDRDKRVVAHRAKGYQLGWVTGPAVLLSGTNGYYSAIRRGAPVTVLGPNEEAA